MQANIAKYAQASSKLIEDMRKQIIELQRQGYLKGIKVYALPEPEDSNGSKAEWATSTLQPVVNNPGSNGSVQLVVK